MQQIANPVRGSAASISSGAAGMARPHSFATRAAPPRTQRHARTVTRAAADDEDDDFEARLAGLKRAKGETPYGEGAKRGRAPASADGPKPKAGRKTYDYTDEKVHFETGPHLGDVAINVALGATLLWLPLSIASVSRAAFVRYRFTDRRLSCITTAPWQTEQLDAAYQEVKDVVTVGRGVGIWGDMLVTLRNGDKIEMRAVPKFLEMKAYILQRRDELTGGSGGGGGGGGKAGVAAAEPAEPKGFAA